jgi:hypothetical protein
MQNSRNKKSSDETILHLTQTGKADKAGKKTENNPRDSRTSQDRWSYLKHGITFDLESRNSDLTRASGYDQFTAFVKELRLRRAEEWNADDTEAWRKAKDAEEVPEPEPENK